MYFHFILFAFYFAFVAAQEAVTCTNGGVAMPATATPGFSGVDGQMCFCGAGSNSCDTALNTDDPEKGPFVGTIQNGRCNLSIFADDTAFTFRVIQDDDFSIGSCTDDFFAFGGGLGGFDTPGFDFSNACVCPTACEILEIAEPGVDTSAVDNLAGDCVCANGQTDVDANAMNCVEIVVSSCAVPTAATCTVGQLQATVNNAGTEETICLPGDIDVTSLPVVVELSRAASTGSIPEGMYTVTFADEPIDDFYPKMTLESVAETNNLPTTTIEWFASGAADSCQVVSEVNNLLTIVPSTARKRQTGTGDPTPMPGIVVAAANGDPHLSRPDGKTFDFKGQDNAIYSFFSSPTTMINVQMGKTMTNHFIKQVGVSFRGEFEVFTLAAQRGPQSYINRINRKLNKVGGKARFPKHNIQQIIELELCQGHRVVLKKMVTKHGKRDNYFDIEVEVPGCHDDFDGALGQIYKCKYAEHKEKFVFDESMEEHYRVETLKSSFGLYNSTMATQPPCKQQIDAASTGPLSGASGHKN